MKGCAASSSRTCRHNVSFLQKGGKGFELCFPADSWFLHVRTTATRSCAWKVEIAKQAPKSRLLTLFDFWGLSGGPLPLQDSAHLAKGTLAIEDRWNEGRNSILHLCVYGCRVRSSVCLVVGQSLPGFGSLQKQELQHSLEQLVFPPEEPQCEMTSCDSATFFNDFK